MTIFWWIVVMLTIISVISQWILVEKAEYPGVTQIVPVLNMYVMIKIAKLPDWYIIWALVPFMNLLLAFVVYSRVAQAFAKDSSYVVALVLFPFIGFPILAFGDCTYNEKMIDYYNN